LCIISCPVDGINNSFYAYPASTVVPMLQKWIFFKIKSYI
jgi:hypothetical protein